MGLEDYEEAVARVDKMKEDQQRKQSFNGLEAIVSLFDTANTVWSKVSAEAKASQNRAHYNGANAMTTRQPLIGERFRPIIIYRFLRQFGSEKYQQKEMELIVPIFLALVASNQTEVAEGRYIQGDPLKGYYDFIITEGSYKFWAIFQVRSKMQAFIITRIRLILREFRFHSTAFHRRSYDLLNICGHLLLQSESGRRRLRLHRVFGRRPVNGRRSRANGIQPIAAVRIGQ